MTIYYVYLIVNGLLYIIATNNQQSTMLSERKKDRFTFFSAIGMILIFGLRAVSVGRDTDSYFYRYSIYESMLHSARYASEFGFNIYNYALAKLGIPWQLYLLITCSVFLIIIFRFFRKYSENIYLSIFFFVTIGTFSMAMSGMRQFLAASLCLLSLMILEEDKNHKVRAWILSVVSWLLAISIHNSAVVFFVYFCFHLAKLRLSKKQVLIGIILAVLALVYGRYLIRIAEFLIPRRYSGMDLDKYYALNPLIIVISITIALFCVAFYKTEKDGKYSTINTIFFMFSILNILFICLSVRANQVGRLLYYFSNANAVLIANAVAQTSTNNKKVIYPVLITVCLLYFYLGSVGGTLSYDNYVFFWMQ